MVLSVAKFYEIRTAGQNKEGHPISPLKIVLPELGFSLLRLQAHLAMAWMPDTETCNFLNG